MNADRANNQSVCINGLWASEMFRYNERMEYLWRHIDVWDIWCSCSCNSDIFWDRTEFIHTQSPDINPL